MDERNPEPPSEHSEERFDPQADDFQPKIRSYLHFDSVPDPAIIAELVRDPSRVASHSFFPFLGFSAEERRYKRIGRRVTIEVKTRDIRYASHLDSAIYEYYASLISSDYENFLSEHKLSESVLAYRAGIGSNIDHAENLFREIKKRGNCVCIALDISKFFDNLDHRHLKRSWSFIVGKTRLPLDHFKVFESLTNYSWVSKEALQKRLGRKLRPVAGRRICTIAEFRERVRGQKPSIINKNNGRGIPQGSSLSGLLANIYLFEVDRILNQRCVSIGASYRRYSDDIAIIAPFDLDQNELLEFIRSTFENVGLSLNTKKTEISRFTASPDGQQADRRFQYLGFTFDGRKKLIRDSSLNRYYKKMTRSIRSAKIAAEKKKIPLDKVFLRRHYKTYTHKGQGRNFVRYAFRAARKMESRDIRRQLRNHTRIFERKIAQELGF